MIRVLTMVTKTVFMMVDGGGRVTVEAEMTVAIWTDLAAISSQRDQKERVWIM